MKHTPVSQANSLESKTLLYNLPDSEVDSSGSQLSLAVKAAGYNVSPRVLIGQWNCWSITVEEFLATLSTPSEQGSQPRGETSFTPGQWTYQRAAHDTVIDSNGIEVAWVSPLNGAPDGESAANARLIAAAPDLLEACVELVDFFACLRPDQQSALESFRKAKAAISKALNT